jgi:hypothetical protein
MPNSFPGVRKQDAAPMALPPPVFGGTFLSLVYFRLEPSLPFLSREGMLCQGADLVCWAFTSLGMLVVILCNILVSEFG